MEKKHHMLGPIRYTASDNLIPADSRSINNLTTLRIRTIISGRIGTIPL